MCAACVGVRKVYMGFVWRVTVRRCMWSVCGCVEGVCGVCVGVWKVYVVCVACGGVEGVCV